MTIALDGHQPRFEIGRVINGSFSVLRRYPIRLAVLGLLFAGLPWFLEGRVRHLLLISGDFRASAWVSFGLTSLIPFTGLALLNPAVAALLFSPQARGSIVRSLGVLLRSGFGLVPYWVANAPPPLLRVVQLARSPLDFSSMAWTAIKVLELGLAIFLVLTVAVYAPVVVIERFGVARSFTRTLELMRIARWQILAVYALLTSISGVVSLLIRYALAASGLADVTFEASVAIGGLAQLAWSVVVAASYLELVRAHDGAAPADVAEVFA